MAKIKNIEAFCNFCNTIVKMELSGEVTVSGDQNKRWAKCKKCKQTSVVDITSDVVEKKPSVEGIENDENCVSYEPAKTFNIGDVIFHKSWNDFGKVVGKEILANGFSSISVEFQKLGNKKLLESITNQTRSEVN